jgi:hypothetical protein
VSAWQGHHESLVDEGHERDSIEWLDRAEVARDTNLDPPLQQLLVLMLRQQRDQFDLHAGVRRAKCAQRPRQNGEDRGSGVADAQNASPSRRDVSRFLLEAHSLGKQGPGAWVKVSAQCGQAHGAPRSVEQLAAEI